MSDEYWHTNRVDYEPNPLTLEMLQKMFKQVQEEGKIVHPSKESPHLFNPRILQGKNSLCEYCGVDYFTLQDS